MMATGIDYCPLVPKVPVLRRCRVPDMWGRISLDWNNNNPLPKGRLQSSLVSEDSKMVLKPCSVRVERCNVSASSLVWGVEKVRLEDRTVQLLYHGVRVRDGDSEGAMETSEDGCSEKKYDEMHEEPQYLGLGVKCPKCGQMFNDKRTLVCHVVSHFYELFFKVLPDSKPFHCPICDKIHINRSTLVRHYALKHGKIFEMTDLNPEDLPGIGTGKRVDRWSKPTLLKKKFSINNNCLEKNNQADKNVMDDELAFKSEKYDDKIEPTEADDQLSHYKCPKCGKHVKVVPKNILRFHMLTHYYQVFFDVLPDKKPFNCPLCDQSSRDRVTLARHYAFSHQKIFELTDLTPEALLYSERHMKEFEQKKNKLDEKRIQVLLASPLMEIPHNESVETIADGFFDSEEEENMDDSYPTTSPHSVPGITPVPFSPLEDSVELKHGNNSIVTCFH